MHGGIGMRTVSSILVLLICQPMVPAQMQPGPKSPAESLKCMKPRPGFAAELMAAEPLVMDPIAFAWGPDGKFWVVEMGDYPLGTDGKGKFGGRVKFLEKASGGREPPEDRPYNKSTVFLDGLGYPTGVMPWGKGVLVSCAPDIFYAEDTDGDGKADKKIVLFTGFAEGNQQHRVNGFTYGLDNWIYGANGDSGGRIKVVNTLLPPHPDRPKEPVNIGGRDFRCKLDGRFEPQTGQSQFGRARDDWGNWFGNNNTRPMFHYVLEDHYLRRNPHVVYPDPRVEVSVRPGSAPVYPISKPLPRFNSPEAVNRFTSACSAIIYRDDLFGPEFYGNSFVSEPVHNLIHREIVTPKGVTFTSRRADDEQQSEFFASTDNWFRPTMIQTGPDGALWVADMYRYVIEHPQWIPLDWQKKVDLRAGHELGRIYRIYPADKKPRALPRLDKMTNNELAAALDSPSGWQRDMAQMMLLNRGPNFEGDDPAPALRRLLAKSKRPLARLHALCTLDGIGRLDQSDFHDVLPDSHPSVRRHLARILDQHRWEIATVALWKCADDLDPLVRMQVAHTLGRWWNPIRGGEILGHMAATNSGDRYVMAAVFSSIGPETLEPVVDTVLNSKQKPPVPTLVTNQLTYLAQTWNHRQAIAKLLADTARQLGETVTTEVRIGSERFVALANFLDTLEQRQMSLAKLVSESPREMQTVLKKLDDVYDAARDVVQIARIDISTRVAALRLLGRGRTRQEEDITILSGFLGPQHPDEIQSTAAATLGRLPSKEVPDTLLQSWKSYAPTLRAQVMDVLLSRADGPKAVLSALENKHILPLDIDAARRQRLLEHKQADIRNRAVKLLAGSVDPDRRKVVDQYRAALSSTKGDAERGVKVFTKSCSACHQLAGVGQQVGPDLAAVPDKSTEGLLTAILDPNRAVESRYLSYTAATKGGLTFSGLLASETSTSITIVGVDGKQNIILRTDLDELIGSGKSTMPEGLEKDISPPDMADLLAFLQKSLPAGGRKTFVGNHPGWVRQNIDGAMHLTAKNCEIYGKTLVFEEKYANLGYWSSTDDRAVWQLEVARGGKFVVWLDWACDPAVAGNTFVLEAADERLKGKVQSTGDWDTYRRLRIGEISLPVGRQEFVFRAEGAIKGALIDLKEIRLEPIGR